MRKLGLRAKAAIAWIKLVEDRAGNLVHKGRRQFPAPPGKGLIVLDGGHHAGGGLQCLIAPLSPDLRQGREHPPKARPPVAFVGRNIGAAEVGPPVGSQKDRQRPTALAGDRRDRDLIARVHVGPLVAIHLDRYKVLVDEPGDLRVLIGLPVHDVAPMAPDSANVEQDGLVLGPGAGKGRLAPGMPPDGLMARRTQVGTGRVFQQVGAARGVVAGLGAGDCCGSVLVHALRIQPRTPCVLGARQTGHEGIAGRHQRRKKGDGRSPSPSFNRDA